MMTGLQRFRNSYIFCDFPETKGMILSAHGMLPILETCRRRDVIFNLLKIMKTIIFNDWV
jgi:hypothetical protein